MLKKSALRRITVTSVALLIFMILSFFPTSESKSFHSELQLQDSLKSAIYLIDPNDFVSRTQAVLKNQDTLNQAREMIEILTVNGTKSHYLPNGFQAVLPSKTKLLDISIQDGILKLNFDKTFLNVPKEKEEAMIESLIFSLTEIPEVKGLLIFIEDDLLTQLPKSKIKLPTTLTREFGINKTYDITSFKNIVKTTTYYISKYDDALYYVPVTEISNENKAKIEIIIERLKSSPINQTNLMSYLNANAELLDYELLENNINLSFNRYLLDDFDNKKILEEVEYSIALSLQDTLNVDSVNFLVNGEKITNIS